MDSAVKKAMANLPADRFTSATQFAEAIGTAATTAIAVGAAQAIAQEAASGPKAVAVLPFENMSTDPENEYFSDGITDDIIAQLSKISALKVISRTSSMQYKKTTKKIATIAEELGVSAILEGSVRRPGPGSASWCTWWIRARRSTSGASTFDRQLTDVFEVQSEVAQQITGALAVTLSPEEKQRVEKKATGDAEGVQPVPAGTVPCQQVVRGKRAEGDPVLPGGHRQGPQLRASPTPGWPTPTSC